MENLLFLSANDKNNSRQRSIASTPSPPQTRLLNKQVHKLNRPQQPSPCNQNTDFFSLFAQHQLLQQESQFSTSQAYTIQDGQAKGDHPQIDYTQNQSPHQHGAHSHASKPQSQRDFHQNQQLQHAHQEQVQRRIVKNLPDQKLDHELHSQRLNHQRQSQISVQDQHPEAVSPELSVSSLQTLLETLSQYHASPQPQIPNGDVYLIDKEKQFTLDSNSIASGWSPHQQAQLPPPPSPSSLLSIQSLDSLQLIDALEKGVVASGCPKSEALIYFESLKREWITTTQSFIKMTAEQCKALNIPLGLFNFVKEYLQLEQYSTSEFKNTESSCDFQGNQPTQLICDNKRTSNRQRQSQNTAKFLFHPEKSKTTYHTSSSSVITVPKNLQKSHTQGRPPYSAAADATTLEEIWHPRSSIEESISSIPSFDTPTHISLNTPTLLRDHTRDINNNNFAPLQYPNCGRQDGQEQMNVTNHGFKSSMKNRIQPRPFIRSCRTDTNSNNKGSVRHGTYKRFDDVRRNYHNRNIYNDDADDDVCFGCGKILQNCVCNEPSQEYSISHSTPIIIKNNKL